MPEAAKSTVAVLPALSGNPVRLIVKVADASASSLIEAGDAPIEKLTASSIPVMLTVAVAVAGGMVTVPEAIEAPAKLTTAVSEVSIASSLIAVITNDSELGPPAKKVSVLVPAL